jgi:hypothetical protein
MVRARVEDSYMVGDQCVLSCVTQKSLIRAHSELNSLDIPTLT